MNLFAPFFLAHDAFWSSFMPGARLPGQFLTASDSTALALQTASDHGPQSSDYLTSVLSTPMAETFTETSPGEVPPPAKGGAQWLSHTCEQGGDVHHAKVYLPSSYDGRSLPMMVMLHGAQQHPDDFAAGTRMNVLAEETGFIVVYPEQRESANLLRCWNWFLPSNQARSSGETAALAALTRDVIVRFNADRARVYVAGLSAGGAMATNLAVTHPDLYAAAAVHSGMAFGVAKEHVSAWCAMNDGRGTVCLPKPDPQVAPRRTVPLIVFHGDADDTVHPLNSDQIVEMNHLLSRNAADTPACPTTCVERETNGRAYTRDVWRDQNGSLLTERWLVHGLGHAWSGGHADGTYTDPRGPDASAAIVRFVSQFTLDNAPDGLLI
ncbi:MULTISPECIES: PHB depolymerase family esterase [Caballeronia]|jgi:poly(hydroxyalkanoate) depolymerase family esterase|uniref:extracellular catalytic domain type 1 short-chain-length polyhydroxyalkanoate depolymerase n=1 Tax=Caballeronia TaxID=1827195 RepID=UPI001FD5C845|nr:MULTISPECIES: PHB depolymerase family esterase [Caballeronia]MDR5733332.1 PHB depolymerase family esterase [Caballeronia sp. LZ025]